MSHCTKYEFSYSSEDAIVRAFSKLGLKSSIGLVGDFDSDFSKKILGKLGYMGSRQMRAVCAAAGKFNLLVCKIAENSYELMIERNEYSFDDDYVMKQLADKFQRAYVSVAVDETIHRIDSAGVPTRMVELVDGYRIEFGSMFEYSILISISGNQITEEVSGVKGDLCTKLTEQLESILSSPSADLVTEWKLDYTIVHQEQTLQILSARL